jgi:hypothetical protein
LGDRATQNAVSLRRQVNPRGELISITVKGANAFHVLYALFQGPRWKALHECVVNSEGEFVSIDALRPQLFQNKLVLLLVADTFYAIFRNKM